MSLFRAIVSLPDSLCLRERPLQERIVFFEAPDGDRSAAHLQLVLGFVWVTDTTDWCEHGLIYNIHSERELLGSHAFGGASTGDLRMFETGCGGDWAIHYAQPADVDLFVTPRLHKRLAAALAQVPVQVRGVAWRAA